MVVQDSPGFLVNRILLRYLVEAAILFENGAQTEAIDDAMVEFGMPMGPLRLIDEVGVDISADVAATLAEKFRDRLRTPELLGRMMQVGLLGRKSGEGFYIHKDGEPRMNPGVAKFRTGSSAAAYGLGELQRRMALLMVNEAARCLEEKVVATPADVDFSMVMGTGFAPFRGGPLAYADSTGIAKIVDDMKTLVQAGGTQYEPSTLLVSMAAAGRSFMEIETKGKPAAETEQAPVIDTSKMSAEQRDALELTEAARDAAQAEQGFAGGLFMGRFNLPGIFPYPEQGAEDREKGDLFLQKLEMFLRDNVDPDEIDATGEIPQEVIDGLARMGAFGIKIAREYGGLGLSQTNYCRAGMMLGSYCGNLTALISAHQSIGVPQPLIMFGNEQQKRRYLPRVARGEISAFALTEPKVGSDPAKMETHAEPTEDGKYFVLNGEKLWCTNGVKAGVIVVMAKTPPKMVRGKPRNQITAFIVDMHDTGIEVATRCRFMGLKALYNAVIRFKDVKVPRENILLEEGKGLRVALTTLNTGRLTLPAACAGLSKRCLEITTKWANERVQWGQAIGKHAAIADKIARMAAEHFFAMEAMSFFAAALVDRDKKADVRLEAAMCKLWATERAWEIVDDTMQIRGGRGYETAASLKGRGEEPVPVERMMRDSRINLIFEGSSEIMRLFIAREALDPHLKIGAPMLNSQLPLSQRAKAAVHATGFYAKWYPLQWIPRQWFFWMKKEEGAPQWEPALRRHVKFAERASRRLARSLFHAMALNGPKLESKQILLGRFVDIGTELFAITAACSRAQAMLPAQQDKGELLQLADYFCRLARLRVNGLFDSIHRNADRQGYSLARKVLEGKYGWLGRGMVRARGRCSPVKSK